MKIFYSVLFAYVAATAEAQTITNTVVASSGAWQRLGEIFSSSAGSYEPSVLFEGSAQVIPTSGNVFKMYLSVGGIGTSYSESIDGIHGWTTPTTLVSSRFHNCIAVNAGTYYLYVSDSSNIYVYTASASNGPFTLAGTAITPGTSGTWDDASTDNCSVIIEGGTWEMLYDANGSLGYYAIGLATSSDGVHWTKSGSNPLITGVESGAPMLFPKATTGGVYQMWGLSSNSTSVLPTDLYRWSAPSLTGPWTRTPACILCRLSGDEGPGLSMSQLGDPWVVSANGYLYLYYTANYDQTPSSLFTIKVATSTLSLSSLLKTVEGGSLETAAVTGLPYIYYPNPWGQIPQTLEFVTDGTYNIGGGTTGPGRPNNIYIVGASYLNGSIIGGNGEYLHGVSSTYIDASGGTAGDFSITNANTFGPVLGIFFDSSHISSDPYLKVNGNGLRMRNASDTADTAFTAGSLIASTYITSTNCASSASPAVCGSAAAGAVAIPTGVSSVTLVVNSTAVTANSRIILTPDDSLTISATTCNSTLATLVGGMAVTGRTPGTSFTITYNGTIATNPLCVSYVILN